MSKLIDSVSLPAGLRSLAVESLSQVVEELRDELIETVSLSGGHFASSLGAAEISVVLHYLFQTPDDKLVWDTGHQCYIHKMLTGRREQMGTIRQFGGISGFLSRQESEFDAFGAGHAGTSISAAVGMAAGLRVTNPERHVVAIIGDGSLTAGMAFEALNHAGDLGLSNLIVILNDNEMSISPNVGALSWLFSRAVTSKLSTKARSKFKHLYRQGYVPEFIYKAVDRAEEAAQGFFATPSMLFESFGFRYIGPIDGHNVEELHQTLKNAKEQDVPVLVHVRTRKGKGFEHAEDDPVKWHAVKPFDRKEVELIQVEQSKQKRSVSEESKGTKKATETPAAPPKTFTSAFTQTVSALIEADKRVVAITAAMAGGTGLDSIAEKYPDNFFDVGICEQHAATFAAGLACQGLRPICAIYSTFLQRGFDQVLHDVCLQNLPVIFAIDRAGAVGNDGETHQGLFDISYLRCIPDLVLMAPADENELQNMFFTALSLNRPVAIRYPRGAGPGKTLEAIPTLLPLGKGEVVTRGSDILFLCYGPLHSALEAAQQIKDKYGLTSTVVNARFAKPLDHALLKREVPLHRLVCTIEDNVLAGGFGSAVLETCNDLNIEFKNGLQRFGAADQFVPHGTQTEQLRLLGYDSAGLVQRIEKVLSLLEKQGSDKGAEPITRQNIEHN